MEHSLALHTPHDSFIQNKKIYKHTGHVLLKVERILSKTKVFQPLKKSYFYLKMNNRIILKTDDNKQENYGNLEFSLDGINNSNIVINAQKSLIDMSATLIHELRHYYDLKNLSTKTSYLNILALELSAFNDTYLFFKEMCFLNTTSYMSLSCNARELLEQSYIYHLNNKEISPQGKMNIINLMNSIGYSYDKCNYVISFSTKKRLLDNAIKYNSNQANAQANAYRFKKKIPINR